MAGRSRNSRRKSSKATAKPTSSPASPAGPSPSNSPVGLQASLFGPEAALANPFRAPASVRARMTQGTSGLTGIALSRSFDLQLSLASKVRATLEGCGSPEFVLTFRIWDMPSGAPICAVRGRGRRRSGKGCSSWPTPLKADGRGSAGRGKKELPNVAALASWPAACSQDGPKGGPGQGADRLPGAAALASWAAPAAKEAGGTPEQFLERKRKAKAKGAQLGVSLTSLNLQVECAGWPAPLGNKREASRRFYGRGNMNLAALVEMLSFEPTSKDSPRIGIVMNSASDVSLVEIPNGAALSPEFSRWLQGYPRGWHSCEDTETPSSPG
jgi:hypothetical protein